MTVHFSRWWNTPTVTSNSVLDVRTAEKHRAKHPTRDMKDITLILLQVSTVGTPEDMVDMFLYFVWESMFWVNMGGVTSYIF